MFAKRTFAAACVALLTAGGASAMTIKDQYEATSAVGSGADHSIWLAGGNAAGIGRDFSFDPLDPGMLTIYDDGTATLTGTAVSQSLANSGFIVNFNYDSDFSDNPDPTPEFKSENGSQPAGDLFFLDVVGGTLEGYGLLAGLNITITQRPEDGKYVFQIGSSNGVNNGPNNKNENFGGAHWFTATVTSANCGTYCNNANALNGQGDVNIDLALVPLPASALLLLGGLGALGAVRRRRKPA